MDVLRLATPLRPSREAQVVPRTANLEGLYGVIVLAKLDSLPQARVKLGRQNGRQHGMAYSMADSIADSKAYSMFREVFVVALEVNVVKKQA